MKRIAAVLLGLALAAPASAQEQKPAPQASEQKAPEKKEPARMASRKPNPKRQEDARHCLDKPTNTEIIKCAEEYL
jgi:hypothetical protein